MFKSIFSIVKSLPFFIIPILLLSSITFSQYIGSDNPEDESREDLKENYKKKIKDSGTLPPHIAYNIKAIKIPYMDNAIRISWNVNPNYDDIFILGRSNDVIDINRRALTSKSITVITPRSKNIFVDDNMNPGNYYYVILSRAKIYNKDIELYKDINYTSLPVIILPKKEISGYVRNIFIRKLNDGKILVGWDKINETKTIYSIYRSSSLIDTPDKLRKSKRISMVVDDNEFIDEKIQKSKNYHYAITVKNVLGIENFHLVPNQNYTTRKIKFEKEYVVSVTNIETYQVNNDIKIQWNIPELRPETQIKGYEIYRSNSKIDEGGKVYSAKLIATVDKASKSFMDKNPRNGSNFYAVLIKFKDGITRLSLKKGVNFTTSPVKISSSFRITSIKAGRSGRRVIVTWNYSGKVINKKFRIYRSKRKIKKVSKLRKKYFLKTVNIKRKKYIDARPLSGNYYYIISPYTRSRNFKIISGVTITKKIYRIKETGPESDEIDAILKDTFFKGRYKVAVKELNNFIDKTDNERDVAKAQLFIGRVYMEMKRYKRAMGYFILSDVKKFYFDEAKFWRDLTMVRLTN